MNYTTRNANEDDKPWLDKLRREAYRDLFVATWGGWDEERHNRHFSSCWDDGNIKIIEQNVIPVGMIQILDSGIEIEVAEIQIVPKYQGKGLATAIITDILARAEKDNKKVTLSTGIKNFEALKLYQRLGFNEVKRKDSKIYLER
jgi:ribosomal protein S18 acetylase RimI-like enzyme